MTALLLLLLPYLPQTGVASWYGGWHDGRQTASGLIFQQEQMTCASNDLPMGTLILVDCGGKPCLLRVTDTGDFGDGMTLDLSRAAFACLTHGDTERGLLPVRFRVVGRETTGMLYGIGEEAI